MKKRKAVDLNAVNDSDLTDEVVRRFKHVVMAFSKDGMHCQVKRGGSSLTCLGLASALSQYLYQTGVRNVQP